MSNTDATPPNVPPPPPNAPFTVIDGGGSPRNGGATGSSFIDVVQCRTLLERRKWNIKKKAKPTKSDREIVDLLDRVLAGDPLYAAGVKDKSRALRTAADTLGLECARVLPVDTPRSAIESLSDASAKATFAREPDEKTVEYILNFITVGWSTALAKDEDTKKKDKSPNSEEQQIIDRMIENGTLTAVDKAKRYGISKGALVSLRWEQEGDAGEKYLVIQFDPLTNFVAKIDSDVKLDDGSDEIQCEFSISGEIEDGTPLWPISVRSEDFASLKWVIGQWGSHAIIRSGQGITDKAREAIQTLSEQEDKRVYVHTGWRQVGDRRVCLHAIEKNEMSETIEVKLRGALKDVQLPDKAENIKGAVEASLAILDVAPRTVTVPLLGATYLASASAIITPDFLTWLYGKSGQRKSELAALCMSHFGTFPRERLPLSWFSTEASIENTLFLAKDCLTIVDDYKELQDQRAQKDLEKKAVAIITNIGNRTSRSRSRWTGKGLETLPSRPPRGVVISTGEILPPGHSNIGRLVPAELEEGAMDLGKLSRAQAQATRHLYPHAMRGYIEWFAANYDKFAEDLPKMKVEEATKYRDIEGHTRIAEALASLLVGHWLLAAFAEHVGVFTRAEAQQHVDDARKVLRAVGVRAQATVAEVEPAERYIAVLRALLTTQEYGLAITHPHKLTVENLRGDTQLGWYDSDYAYLDPEMSLKAVVKHCTTLHLNFVVTPNLLHAALAKKKYIEPSEEGGKLQYAVKVRLGDGRRPRGLRIPIGLLNPKASAADLEAEKDPPANPKASAADPKAEKNPPANP